MNKIHEKIKPSLTYAGNVSALQSFQKVYDENDKIGKGSGKKEKEINCNQHHIAGYNRRKRNK